MAKYKLTAIIENIDFDDPFIELADYLRQVCDMAGEDYDLEPIDKGGE